MAINKRKVAIIIAEVEKFTAESVIMLLKHADRQLKNDSNLEIKDERSGLNYSVEMDLKGLTSKEAYEQLVGNSYMYGRGSSREAETVTCCSWVITLPKSVSDYSKQEAGRNEYMNEEAEKKFFEGCVNFVQGRYGTVFYNRTHYDEGFAEKANQPHIHIYFVPLTKLDHDRVHYKTVNTHRAIKTESGRYEYEYRYKTDENGEKIELKNYAKISDYYDVKLSGADVLNKAELQHFHEDLAAYLRKEGVPGADSVHTGVTGGKNVSVKSMKELTRATGLTIDEVKEMKLDKEQLEELLAESKLKSNELVEALQMKDQTISNLQNRVLANEATISDLWEQLAGKDREIEKTKEASLRPDQEKESLKMRVEEQAKENANLKLQLEKIEEEYAKSQERIKELETEKERALEQESHSWNAGSGWGRSDTIERGDRIW